MSGNWRTASLGDTCEMYQPKTISGKDLIENGPYPVFGANGIIGRYDKFSHEEPQLLITCRGATCGTVNISEPRSWFTGNAMVVRPKDAAIDLRFLEYVFRGGIDLSTAITGSAQPQITRTNLAPIKISFPTDSAEQQRIVGLLDEAFDGIATAKANAEKNLQNARALFESHLQSVFTQRHVSWKDRALVDLCAVFVDSAHRTPKYQTEGIPALRPRDVVNGLLTLDTAARVSNDEYAVQAKRHRPAPGDIVYSRELSFGWAAKLPETPLICLSQGMCLFRPSEEIESAYLLYFLNGPIGRDHAKRVAVGTSHPHINLSDIRAYSIPVPPVSEQKKIVAKFDSLCEETQRLESLYQRKLTALDELKKSLLHQAFSGAL